MSDCSQLWIRKRQEAQAQVVAGSILSQYMLLEIEKSKSELPKMRAKSIQSVFAAENLRLWQISAASFSMHACGRGMSRRWIEWGAYVDPVFGMEVVFSVYAMDFPPISDQRICRSGMDRQLSQTQLCAASARGVPCPQEYGMRWTWLSARRRDADYADIWVIPGVVALMPYTLRMSSFYK
ncbi:hypothetical protein PIB30_100471 [Stylosanthes scabra]|uniref:Uncharacterized protein n=1 Tax=Stylosanthes scabra TaxID=79078 RepID=A0ABU6UXZ7_9FABA|nr:hypothetical protein [Stylosanthes scabra]